jgi:hypothetical protein
MRILIISFLFFSSSIFASFQMNERMQQSYLHIINLEFEAANNLLRIEKKKNPNNGIIVLHQNYIDFLTIIIGEDEVFFTIAKEKKSERIDLIQEGDENSPYYLYAQAEIHLQWAFSRLKFEQYSTAAYEFITAYNLLEENQERFPDFTLNKKGTGLMHAFLGAVPKQFHWILNLAGLEGGLTIGLSEMDAVLNDKNFKIYEKEVLFLLSFLQINLSNNDQVCKKYLKRIGDDYQENLLLNFTAARLSHVLGMNEYCLKVLENRPSNEEKYNFYYLDYLQGMSYLYKSDYKKAEQYFNHFIKNFRGINYIKSANHKLAWIAFLQNNIEMKRIYFARVISEGNTSIDEDKVALKHAQRDYITHTRLLRTRLLYDGGYYEKALAVISGVKKVSEYAGYLDEYWYRLARIESKLDYDDNILIKNFKESYELGQNTTNYYAPMSALQIGLIYERQNRFEQAEIYFEKCLAMSNFDYERGIHQKAKAGINRIAD